MKLSSNRSLSTFTGENIEIVDSIDSTSLALRQAPYQGQRCASASEQLRTGIPQTTTINRMQTVPEDTEEKIRLKSTSNLS